MSTIKSSAENLTLNADGANNDIKFQSNGSEVASIDQDGLLTTAGGLAVNSPTSLFPTFTTTSATSDVAINLVANSNNYTLGYDYSSNALKVVRGTMSSTTGLSIESTGDVTVGAGDIVFGTGGKGIVLGATTNVDANTLDDYEEGTFTATLTGSIANPSTAVTETAYYTKVGNVVQIAISFNNENTAGASGNVQVTGLPFTAAAGVVRTPLSAIFYLRFAWATDRAASMLIPAGSDYINGYATKGGDAWDSITHSAGTAMHLWISGTYQV